MKRNLLLVLMLFLSSFLFAQIEKGDFLFSIEGNYLKNQSSTGLILDKTLIDGKYLNLGFRAGYMLSDNVIGGIGISYLWEKESKYNLVYVADNRQLEQMDVKSSLVLPNIYLGYITKITKGLYINPNIEVAYGTLKSEYSAGWFWERNITFQSGVYYYDDDDFGSGGNTRDSRVDYFSISIVPKIMFFATRNIYLNLSLGGISYAILDWEEESSSWEINFNPKNWSFGFGFKL